MATPRLPRPPRHGASSINSSLIGRRRSTQFTQAIIISQWDGSLWHGDRNARTGGRAKEIPQCGGLGRRRDRIVDGPNDRSEVGHRL